MKRSLRLGLVVAAIIAIALSLALAQRRGGQSRPRPNAQRAAIHRIEELTATQIGALDRNKTLFLLPVGMLEQHGPHLPIGSDTYSVNFEVDAVANRLGNSLAGWTIILMPILHYGEGGANQIGNIQVHPGTYGIRHTTLRAIVADIGGQIAQNGFKWIFVLHGHGSPYHNIAISDASDFISEAFRVTMLNITSIQWADPEVDARTRRIAARYYSPADMEAFGLDIHAGTSETSGLLAIQPRLVRNSYRNLPARNARSPQDLRRIATTPGWEGYFAAPARASAAYGRELAELSVEASADFIRRALGGENLFGRPRYPVQLIDNPAIQRISQDTAEHQRAFAARLDQWLRQRGKE